MKQLWAAPIGKPYDPKGNVWNRGPNAAPTVDGERLYALGSQGILVCVDTTNGKVVWNVDLVKDLGAEVDPVGGAFPQGWGFSWSPLVDGNQVIITPGGKK